MIRVARFAFAFVLAATALARADDGPRRGIREVRAAVPVLVRSEMDRLSLGTAVDVDDAIVGHDRAIVDFHGTHGRGIAVLVYRSATWWLTGSVFEDARDGWSWWTYDSPKHPAACDTTTAAAPTAASLRDALAADSATVAQWSAHVRPPTSGLPAVISTGDEAQACSSGATYAVYGFGAVSNDDGYRATWTATATFPIVEVHGRAPNDAEMSGPGANSIFYVYASGAAAPIVVPKSTLTVWCPFVLDPGVHYEIEFSGADEALGPVVATLDDNTLTFEIPAFTAAAHADLRGEIDYLPWRPH